MVKSRKMSVLKKRAVIIKPKITFRTTLKRINKNPFHNIWNNNGTYWIHYTTKNKLLIVFKNKGKLVNGIAYEVKRNRKSLKTSDINLAVKRRDKILKSLECHIYGEQK
jgi:hypothetical protein